MKMLQRFVLFLVVVGMALLGSARTILAYVLPTSDAPQCDAPQVAAHANENKLLFISCGGFL